MQRREPEERLEQDAIRSCVERARAGDSDAFAELFRAFRPDVGRLCTRLLGSADEAEDALNETFSRVHRSLEKYDSGRPFRTWLLSVAAYHCIDRLRRRNTESRIFDAGDLDPDQLATAGPSPLDHRLRREVRQQVLDAIEQLPDCYRVPLVMRYYADFDYDTIGEALDVTRNQVATLLFRGKRKLREALRDGGYR